MGTQTRARQLALLGIILQCLHFLFGITAIIGMLIAHTHLNKTEQTVYRTHLVWQLCTFWGGLLGYVLGFWIWNSTGQPWLVLIIAALISYRIVVNIQYWVKQRAIVRLL